MITLSEEQEIVHDGLIKWVVEEKKLKKIRFHIIDSRGRLQINRETYKSTTGYAGTGKTTLISKLKESLENLGIKRIAFCSFTGKAASVMAKKLNYNPKKDVLISVSTMHSLMYEPKIQINPNTGKKEIVGWDKRPDYHIKGLYDLIIVDEASTLTLELGLDITSFNIPVLFFGDNGQLPPIGNSNSNVLLNPDFVLKQIHRQALDNPIIRLSMFVRKHGYIPMGVFDKGLLRISWSHSKTQEIFNNFTPDENSMVLCGFNKTRNALNMKIRDRLGFTKNEPYPTDRVICLKNNHETRIMNGMLGTVAWVSYPNKNTYHLTIQMDGFDDFYSNYVHDSFFGVEKYETEDIQYKARLSELRKTEKDAFTIDFFDYGYASSVHKSQGSEWDNGIIFEERTSFWDDEYYKKWLYTALTRFKNKVCIITK